MSILLLVCALLAVPIVLVCAWRYPIQTFIWSMVVLPVWVAPAVPGAGHLYPPCAIALIGIVSVICRGRADIRIDAPLVAVVAGLFLTFTVGGYVLGGIAAASTVPVGFWAVPFVFGLLAQREHNSPAKILDSIRWGGLTLAVFAIFETLLNGTSRCTGPGASEIAALTPAQRTGYDGKTADTCITIGKLFPILNEGSGSLQDVQTRGGMLRAEVTWGHSIALSGILAAALYLWLTSHSRFKYPAAALCTAAVFLSGSRSGLICVGIAMGLAILRWSYGSATRQLILPAAFAVVGVSVYAVYSAKVDMQTQTDYSASSAYRERLVAAALDGSNLWGPADQYKITEAGARFMRFLFLDNSLIQTLVGAGWVAAVCLAILYAVIAIKSVWNLRNPMWSVLVLQLPGLLSAGFFTQHQMLFWFVVGAACYQYRAGVPEDDVPVRSGLAEFRLEAR